MYAIIENEKIDEELSSIRDWFLEEPKNYEKNDYTEDELSRLRALSSKITEIIEEHEKIVNDHCERLFGVEEKEEDQTTETEKNTPTVSAHAFDAQEFIEKQQEYNRILQTGIEIGKNCEEPYHVQFLECSGTVANEKLKEIPGKDIIDVRRLQYENMIILYKEYDKE